MLGEQLDSVAVRDGIALREVSHRFHEQALAIDIAGIRGAFASWLTTEVVWNRDRKNLGHDTPN